MIAKFEIPTDEIIRMIHEDKYASAMSSWMLLPHTLLNGVRIRPTVGMAETMVKAVKLGIGRFPLCVSEGTYEVV